MNCPPPLIGAGGYHKFVLSAFVKITNDADVEVILRLSLRENLSGTNLSKKDFKLSVPAGSSDHRIGYEFEFELTPGDQIVVLRLSCFDANDMGSVIHEKWETCPFRVE